jgi:hypothetical protein
MWWNGLENSQMYASMGNYHFINLQRELVVDGRRLFPVRQKLFYKDDKIDVFYEAPIFVDNFWYPSVINVKIGPNSFTLEITKIQINPPLDENVFIIPS